MKKKDVISQLAELSAASADWFRVAEIVREGIRKEAWKEESLSRAVWLEDAAKAAGYTAATLRRLVKALDFLKGMVTPKRLTTLRTTNIPIGALEILMRMHELAPDRAKTVLDKTLSGELSYRQLKGEHDQLVHERARRAPPKMFSPRLFRQFEDRAVHLVEENVQGFVGDDDVVLTRDPRVSLDELPLTRPDLIAIKRTETGIKFIDGFEFHYIRTTLGQSMLKNFIVEAIAFRASFYRHYWIIIQEEIQGKAAEILRERLLKLGRFSVGIIYILPVEKEQPANKEKFKVILEPKGPPVPDLTQMFISVIRSQLRD